MISSHSDTTIGLFSYNNDMIMKILQQVVLIPLIDSIVVTMAQGDIIAVYQSPNDSLIGIMIVYPLVTYNVN